MNEKSIIVMWISVSLGVIAGLWITQNPMCLWGFVIPGFITFIKITIDALLS